MSFSRQMRRAAERRAQKEARKQQRTGAIPLENSTELLSTAEADLDAEFDQLLKSRAAAREFRLPQPDAPVQAPPLEAACDEPVHSGPTGPRTPEGKAVSSLNNLKHGLTGGFRVLAGESQTGFDAAHDALIDEHQPQTATEFELIRRMAEHAWLSRRAQNLLDLALAEGDDNKFALYLRYQTTNDRGFRTCLNDLLRLRRERRRDQKEFESQNRNAESHAARVRLANARSMHLELDSEIRSVVDAPIPGYSCIPLEQVKELFRSAMLSLHGREHAA